MPRFLIAALLIGASPAFGQEAHWAFQAPQAHPVPTVQNSRWPRSDVDRFLLAAMESRGLAPVADADAATWIRRVCFDLTGLPPSRTDAERFAELLRRDAVTGRKKIVDELLDRPEFGEQWGRHWLDVARYAESSGKEQNILYSQAWRYRNWVIAAFQRDLPYPEFLQQQLAGDLLPASNPTERAEKLIATGYLAVGPKSHNERVPLQFRLDVADEQIDAWTQGMLGVTVACARCHDHKFDPISQEEYAALAGIFTSTNTLFGTPVLPQARNGAPLAELPAEAQVTAPESLSRREILTRRTLLAQLEKQREEAMAEARKDGQPPVRLIGLNARILALEATLANFEADGTAKKRAMAVADKAIPRDGVIYRRGETDQPGETIPRGVPTDLGGPAFPKIASGSGRKELAEWVTHPGNPLTARVWVTRVWGHLFGKPIVATPDNFGTTGAAPSHPELLDTLAVRFRTGIGSTKELIRELVLSRAYGLSSDPGTPNAAKLADPDAIFVWRRTVKRLPAESIRDAMLAVSGTLDRTPPVGSPLAALEGPIQAVERFVRPSVINESNHRSVYLPILRNQVPEALELFDFAEPSLVTGQREETSVPAQALFLMNNPRVLQLSEQFAERLRKEARTPTERLTLAFQLALGRNPTANEREIAGQFLRSTSGQRNELATWATFCQGLFCTAEFRFLN
jgi:hypothetical protein